MIARHVTLADLEAAADASGVTLYSATHQGRGIRFRLHTTGRPPRYGRRGFTRKANGERRRVPGAVCWHGHRAFMRALYARVPGAVLITACARYESAEHFEATHATTADRIVGSQMDPVTYGELCDCPDVDSPRRFHAEIYSRAVAASTADHTITPEETLRDADWSDGDGVTTERWADQNARINALVAGRA